MSIRVCSVAAMGFIALLCTRPASAQGAVAIGLPPNVAEQGVALGWAINSESEGAAKASALEQCLAFEGAPAETRALCKVFRTFHDQCVAVAIDPEDGTPGFGWAVAASRQQAESDAMASCVATAGAARRQYCKVGVSKCDGSAQ